MGAIVFNINANPSQQTNSVVSSTQAIKPTNLASGDSLSGQTLKASKISDTTALFLTLNVAKQASNLITQNVGKITGNSHFQNNVNIALKAGALSIGFATHPIMTSIAFAFDGANYAINNYFKEREDKIRSAQASAIAGTLRGRKN